MGSSPLFNPYTPAGQSTSLDHFDFTEEVEEQEQEAQGEGSNEEARDEAVAPPPMTKRD
jgi:hypothetical protein